MKKNSSIKWLLVLAISIIFQGCYIAKKKSYNSIEGQGLIIFQKKNTEDLKTYYAVLDQSQHWELIEYFKNKEYQTPLSQHEKQEKIQRSMSKYYSNIDKNEQPDFNAYLKKLKEAEEREDMKFVRQALKGTKLKKLKDGATFTLPHNDRKVNIVIAYELPSGEKSKKQFVTMLSSPIVGHEKYILNYNGSGKRRNYYLMKITNPHYNY